MKELSKPYQAAINKLQFLLVNCDKVSQETKIMYLRMINAHVAMIQDHDELKAVAVALAKYGKADDEAIVQISVFFRLEEKE